MDAHRVVQVLARLDAAGVTAWLDGGWGIDALLGRQTRTHDDLDLIVALDDVPMLEHVLGTMGFAKVHGEPPLSFELTDPEGHQIDAHPVTFSPSGEGIYKLASGEDWVYPPGSLSAIGTVLGQEVRCQTPEMQMRAHTTGYALDEVHRNDVTALSDHFGLALPEFATT
jgi:lincosamide nucleotidyltransferase A/C/D/E